MSLLVTQCRDGKSRQTSAFGRLGKDDSAAIFAAVEKQFLASTELCKSAASAAGESFLTTTRNIGVCSGALLTEGWYW